MRKAIIRNGTITGFADEIRLNGLDVRHQTKSRVSSVLPSTPVKKALFRLLRALCEDNSSLAAWTRTWRGPWTVQIDRKNYGPFKARHQAIAFEKQEICRQGKLGQE